MMRFLLTFLIAFSASFGAFASPQNDGPSITMGFSGHMLKGDDSMVRAGLFTDTRSYPIALAHGWMQFADTPDYRWWVAWQHINGVLTISLKSALRVEHGDATQVSIITFHAVCQGHGNIGGAIWGVSMDKYQVYLPDPIEDSYTPQPIPLPVHSVLANAVFAVCQHMNDG